MHVITRSPIVTTAATAEVPPRRAARVAIWPSLNPEQLANRDISLASSNGTEYGESPGTIPAVAAGTLGLF